MSYISIKHLSREQVEELANDAGMGSFARQALLEADFIGEPVRFILVGKSQLVVQRISNPKSNP